MSTSTPPTTSTTKTRNLGDVLQEFRQHRLLMQRELQKVIIGQDEVIEQIFAAIFTRGHCLLVGVPGLAKTLIVSTLAQILDLQFKRIQFTPDLMPSDITGTNVLEEDERRAAVVPVRRRADLHEHSAGRRNQPHAAEDAGRAVAGDAGARSDGRANDLSRCPNPFFMIATQNPIEQEGTYPLPEAQLDRFMFNIKVDYPSAAEEEQILAATTRQEKPEVTQGAFGAGDSESAEAGRLGGGERAHHQVRGVAGAGDAAEG